MKTVGAYEAKTNLSRLLDEVAAGEEVVITKHGVPVARLVPVGPERRRSTSEAIEELKELRKGVTLGEGLTIRQLVEEGRR